MHPQVVVGAMVDHATYGRGVVVVAQDGFPKVKVRFDVGVEAKIDRDQLRVTTLPEPAEVGLVRTIRELRAARGNPGSAGRHGLSYEEAEIELVYRIKKTDANRRDLARLLGRTEDAIDYVWRWCDGADFPPEALNDISRKVEVVAKRTGRGARGTWSTLPAPLRHP